MKNINEKQKALERLHDEYRRQLKEKNQPNTEEEWIKLHIDENDDGVCDQNPDEFIIETILSNPNPRLAFTREIISSSVYLAFLFI